MNCFSGYIFKLENKFKICNYIIFFNRILKNYYNINMSQYTEYLNGIKCIKAFKNYQLIITFITIKVHWLLNMVYNFK